MAQIFIDIHTYVERLCCDFRTEETPVFTVSVTEEEIARESVSGEGAFSAGYCEGLAVYRKICRELLAYDAFLMHAAVIAIDRKAYAFTAKSGTGKATHIRLWQQFGERVEVVNGDKPILRLSKGEILACGTPWRGKENMGANICRPLRGLCFVEHGPGNHIRRMTQKEVVDRVFHQLLLSGDEGSFGRYMDLIERLLATAPCYLLSCTPEPEAAKVAYEGMVEGRC